MPSTQNEIDREISWFNRELDKVQAEFTRLLRDLGHNVEVQTTSTTNQEELSGSYQTTRYDILIDGDLALAVYPYGIWLIGAHGRIDVKGPSGTEKLIYLKRGGPALRVDISSGGNRIESDTSSVFQHIDEEGWYWYDDSSYRRVAKLNHEVAEAILERVQ